jgi:hypothetical protein
VTLIEYQQQRGKSSLQSSLGDEKKIITGSMDSTMRVWKLIKTQDSSDDIALKEEYEFLINGETITHICVAQASNLTTRGFVYMVTDSNRIRKISLESYQIVKEKNIPVIEDSNGNNKTVNTSIMKVLSVAINNNGKILLIVCNNQLLIMD